MPRDRSRSRSPPRNSSRYNSERNSSRRDYNSRNDDRPRHGYSERDRELERKRDRDRYDERGRQRSGSPGRPKSRSKSPVEENKAKPNFKASGLLAAETNTVKTATGEGTVLKYNEPPEARKPLVGWRLYGFKGDEQTGK